MTPPPRDRAGLRVLQSFPGPRPTTNPYLTQLVRSVPPEITVRGFSWRDALRWRYDVLHLHWPENLLRGSSWWKTGARQVLVAALLLRCRRRRTAIVRTLHNTEPHEGGSRVERALLRSIDRRTTLWIRLNDTTPTPLPGPVRTIVHGHYRDWYASFPREPVAPGLLMYFGLIRPYKGVDTLLESFRSVVDDTARLRLVGRPTTADLRSLVDDAIARDHRVTARLEYVDDAALVAEVSAASLVVLPYREMHNSGVLLLALSLDTPVLVPRNEVSRRMAEEVGTGWVMTYDGALTESTLTNALAAQRGHDRSVPPDLSARNWPLLGAAHRDAYLAAVALARHREGTTP